MRSQGISRIKMLEKVLDGMKLESKAPDMDPRSAEYKSRWRAEMDTASFWPKYYRDCYYWDKEHGNKNK